MNPEGKILYVIRGRVGPGDAFKRLDRALGRDALDALTAWCRLVPDTHYKQFLVCPDAGGDVRLFSLRRAIKLEEI